MMFFTTHSHAHPRRTRRRLANIQNTQKVVLDFSLSASHYSELIVNWGKKKKRTATEDGKIHFIFVVILWWLYVSVFMAIKSHLRVIQFLYGSFHSSLAIVVLPSCFSSLAALFSPWIQTTDFLWGVKRERFVLIQCDWWPGRWACRPPIPVSPSSLTNWQKSTQMTRKSCLKLENVALLWDVLTNCRALLELHTEIT